MLTSLGGGSVCTILEGDGERGGGEVALPTAKKEALAASRRERGAAWLERGG